MIPAFLLAGILGAAVVAVIVMALAGKGLVGLRRAGPGPSIERSHPGVERAATRLAETGPSRAGLALLVAGCALIARVLLFAVAMREQERAREDYRRWIESMREWEQYRPPDDFPGLGR